MVICLKKNSNLIVSIDLLLVFCALSILFIKSYNNQILCIGQFLDVVVFEGRHATSKVLRGDGVYR